MTARSRRWRGSPCARACRAEYEDPADRRFHAEPNACPDCGPRARLITAGDGGPAAGDPVAAAAALLRGGAIVAVKGIGGYHLACRADDEAVVARLRARKHREDRPFALMAEDPRQLVALAEPELARLTAPDRPIVIAARRPDAAVAPSVAPGMRELGVMLPYSPLHHLLLARRRAAARADQRQRLRRADRLHRRRRARPAGRDRRRLPRPRPPDRDAHGRLGRARAARACGARAGACPARLALGVRAARPLLACGAELKSTFCLARDEHAWVGHHIGDLRNWETLRSFRAGIAHFERLFAVAPEVVAHDLHPDYLSTGYALERDGVELVAVQHHHAHLAACLAEHGETGPAVGAIFDGAGLGDDGTVWGGELLVGGLGGYERAGHLWPVPLPGGDAAAREPWRMACAWASAADVPLAPLPGVAPERWRAVASLAAPPPADGARCRLAPAGTARPPRSARR